MRLAIVDGSNTLATKDPFLVDEIVHDNSFVSDAVIGPRDLEQSRGVKEDGEA